MSPAERRRVMRALLASSLYGRRRELRSLAAWSAVQALPALVSGRLVAQAVDHGFLANRTAVGFLWLGVLGASMILGAWGTRETYSRLAAVVEPFRDRLVTLAVTGAVRASAAPGARPDTAGVARLTQHVEIVREAYASVFMVVQTFIVTAVSALVGLLSLVPIVLVLVVPPLLAGLGVFVAVLARTASRQRMSLLADERIAEAASTLAGGLRDVIAGGAEEPAAQATGAHVDDQARATRQVANFTAVQTLAVALGGWLPVVLILLEGSWLTGHGATTGAILGALTYVLQGVQPALQTLIRGIGTNGLWLLVTLERVVEAAVARESTESTPRGRRRPSARPARFDLDVRGVTFRYGPWAEPVIEDLDLAVPEGDHLAIVGPSGVGKSTLAGVLTGMLHPEAGGVYIGGVPVCDLDPATIIRRRVLIPQEAYVFAATLWDNITYLAPGASVAAVDADVDAMGMRPLVERLGGYNAQIQASSLSAGERQLVTLVRAHVSPARVVILDEATCHLDPAAEARAEAAFVRRPGTLVVIAHRITSAVRAQRILVMDGTRTAIGTHDDLVAKVPLYRDLVGHWLSASDGAAPPQGNGARRRGVKRVNNGARRSPIRGRTRPARGVTQ